MHDEKFLLFGGETFYPSGGWNDFKGYFNSIDEAKEFIENEYLSETLAWSHIVFKNDVIFHGKKDSTYDSKEIISYEWEWMEI